MTRRIIHSVILLCLVVAVVTPSRWFGYQPVAAQASIVINKEFQFIRQGSVGTITITGPGIIGAVATVFDRQYPFFPTSNGLTCLVSVDFRQKIKNYPVTVTLFSANGTSLNWEDTIQVQSGEFIAEPSFAMPAAKMYLLNPDIQHFEDERILSIYNKVTPERYWDGPLTEPVQGKAGSPFGTVRTYSDGQTRRHTGVDTSVPTGTPAKASGNGRVVFARELDIHGNVVVVDHGWGVYTSYSHMSALFVVPGQFIMQGDVIGLVGNTGRSTGPHMHWEISVNGNWVDPSRFQYFKLPN